MRRYYCVDAGTRELSITLMQSSDGQQNDHNANGSVAMSSERSAFVKRVLEWIQITQ